MTHRGHAAGHWATAPRTPLHLPRRQGVAVTRGHTGTRGCTGMHRDIRVHGYTRTRVHVHGYTRTRVHVHEHEYTGTRVHAHVHVHADTGMHGDAQGHTGTRVHGNTGTRVHGDTRGCTGVHYKPGRGGGGDTVHTGTRTHGYTGGGESKGQGTGDGGTEVWRGTGDRGRGGREETWKTGHHSITRQPRGTVGVP